MHRICIEPKILDLQNQKPTLNSFPSLGEPLCNLNSKNTISSKSISQIKQPLWNSHLNEANQISFQHLPRDIIYLICSLLNLRDIRNLMLMNRETFKKLNDLDLLWRNLFWKRLIIFCGETVFHDLHSQLLLNAEKPHFLCIIKENLELGMKRRVFCSSQSEFWKECFKELKKLPKSWNEAYLVVQDFSKTYGIKAALSIFNVHDWNQQQDIFIITEDRITFDATSLISPGLCISVPSTENYPTIYKVTFSKILVQCLIVKSCYKIGSKSDAIIKSKLLNFH